MQAKRKLTRAQHKKLIGFMRIWNRAGGWNYAMQEGDKLYKALLTENK